MVQWGPDTVPADRHSGGYDYRDRHLSGFSLTHLSGAGCALYGDFPFLPTTEPIRASPAAPGGGLGGRFQPGFSHASERARPGLYSVRLNPVGGGAIDAALTATTRTGMARFAFPRSPHASVLIDAGGSAKADDLAEVRIDPARREISGSASSGYFCAQRPRYRVYFAAVFDRPFDAYGTWTRQELAPGSTAAADQKPPSNVAAETAQAGAYASFDTRHNRGRHRACRRLLRQRRRGARQPRRREPRRVVSAAGRRGGGELESRPRPRSGSAAAAAATPRPSTRRSTTPCSRRAPSTTPTAATSAWTAPSTTPAAAPSTRTSRAGTSTARRSRCWRC